MNRPPPPYSGCGFSCFIGVPPRATPPSGIGNGMGVSLEGMTGVGEDGAGGGPTRGHAQLLDVERDPILTAVPARAVTVGAETASAIGAVVQGMSVVTDVPACPLAPSTAQNPVNSESSCSGRS